MRLKRNTVVIQFPKFGKAEDLITAAVGEDGPLPAHEFVQAPGLADDLYPGAQEEMICVRKDNLAVEFQKVFVGQRLDRGVGPDRHKKWRLDIAMRGADNPAPGICFRVFFDKLEHIVSVSRIPSLVSRRLRDTIYEIRNTIQLNNNHRVTVTVKPIFSPDRLRVGLFHQFYPAEGVDEHQQRAAR